MLLWILITVCVIYAAHKNNVFEKKENGQVKLYSAIVVSFVAAIFGVIILIFVSLALPTKDVPDQQIQILALNRSEPQISGRAFLGSGYLETGRAWEYIEYYPDKGYDQHSIVPLYSDGYTVRNYRDQPAGSDSAYLIKFKKEYAQNWFKYIALFPSDIGPILYEFHTPSDSIIPEIDIQP